MATGSRAIAAVEPPTIATIVNGSRSGTTGAAARAVGACSQQSIETVAGAGGQQSCPPAPPPSIIGQSAMAHA